MKISGKKLNRLRDVLNNRRQGKKKQIVVSRSLQLFQGSQSKLKTLEQYHDYNSIVESGIRTSNINNRKIRKL